MSFITQVYDLRWVFAAAVVLAYAASKYRIYRRLAAFKGPFSTGWCEVWHMYWLMSKSSHLAYVDVNDKYGKIARVGPNDLVTSSTEVLAHINGVRSPYARSHWYYRAARIEPGKDHIFSQLDETQHQKRRTQVASGYSGKENLNLESDIDTRPFDIGRKIQYFVLDTISTIAFGSPFGDLKADADLNDYIKSSEEGLRFMKASVALGLTPIIHWPPLMRLLGPSEQDKTGYGRMLGTARKMIDARFTKSLERSDMLSSFVRHGLSKEDVFTEMIVQIVAGSDTTATGLRSTLMYLITHPRVFTKLRAEVDEAVSTGAAPAAPDIASDECLRNMPYLQAVVREGLRIHPPITNVAPKQVPDGGDSVIVDGKTYYLPGGTNVGYNAWSVNRDTAIFGDDAEVFRPERWLIEEVDDDSVQRLAEMRRATEMVFGYGKFQCLGKPVAWMEITKVLFEFVRHFDWAIAYPDKPWESRNYIGLFLQDHMFVTISERGT